MAIQTDTETDVQRRENIKQSTKSLAIKRYLIAIGLIFIGSGILFIDFPIIGPLVLLLLANPLFIVILGGWYIGRVSIAGLAHWRRKRRRARGDMPTATPSVSILIPAYNEEDTVSHTIKSIQELDYEGAIETVVVDDGSTDDTWSILQFLSDMHDTLRVITQENAGSSVARNTALEHATNEVVISLDADTELHADAIKEITRHFTSESVVAVGGNVSVSNMATGGWWARTQLFDYAAAMEIGRMFQVSLGYVLCISGAFGAFRRETLLEAGGWNDHWLYSDDFEVSVRIQEYGDVKYTPHAIADTEVPTTIRGWFKQRRAWAQRGVSVMLLHYKKQLNVDMGTVGMIGLPIRAIITIGIMHQVVVYVSILISGSVNVLVNIAWLFIVGVIVSSAACCVMTGALLLFVVDEKPVEHAEWLLSYLTIYRPLHLLARLNGFAQAIWWEISSFGFALRDTP